MTYKLALTQGPFDHILMDAQDILWAAQYLWCWSAQGAYRPDETNPHVHVRLLDELAFKMGWEPTVTPFQIDGNPANFQRYNLRAYGYNLEQDSRAAQGFKSGYRGVTFEPSRRKWVAQLTYQGSRVYYERFDTELEAARAYNEAALRFHGERARLNEFALV